MPVVYRIAIIVGSVSEDSLNQRLGLAIARMGPRVGLDIQPIAIDDLPFYGTHYDCDFPEVGVRLKEAISSADGLLIVTPEYNRSVPAVLKNAIDWASRPPGGGVLTGKPTAVTGASRGSIGTAVAQAHLKSVLSALGVPLTGKPEAYIRYAHQALDDSGAITDEGTERILLDLLVALRDLVERWATVDQSG